MPMTALRYWIVWTLFVTTKASTPNVIVSINGVEQTWLAKRGLFGSDADRVQGRLVHAPAYDELLCEYYMDRENSTITPLVPPEPWIMMVPRGMCTFERKAYAAKVWYGASGVLIYDNLSARYQWNNETSKVTYPRDEWDYECSNGYGFVYNIELDPPAYGRRTLDPILDQTSPNTNCTFELTRETCDSQLCLVTGPAATNTSKYPVCCAWDLPLTMTGDDSAGDTDDVVAIFLTVRQGQALLQHVGKVSVVEARPYQPFNISMIFLWMMAVIITFVASYFAAADFRIFRVALARYQDTKNARQQPAAEQPDNEEQRNGAQAAGNNELEELVLGLDDLNSDDEEDDEGTPLEESSDDEGDQADESHEDEPLEPEQETNSKEKKKWALHSLPPKAKEPKQGPNTWALYSLPPEQRKPKTKRKRPGFKAEQTAETDILPTDGGKPLPEPWATPIGGFEMTHWHVFGFVVLASAMLILLFFFRFYHVVFIFYGFGCAGSVSHLIFGPLLVRVVPKFGDGIVKELNKSVVCGLNGFDITSQLLGYIWAIVWIWFGLSHYRPSTYPFFWISINVFGACFCILALSMMKLNSIKIATMLLIAVFLYDIFFVFITPLFLDGQSIMITVAKGGGGDASVDDFCYRYPEHKDCTGIDFLPMLLVLPRYNDYMDGSVLLGLGDIVLPGYLIAFCARLDEAKLIVGKHTKNEMEYPKAWYHRYFFWIMVAYAIGLVLAFTAFCITGVGQPALLYLVPCCLGMILILGRKEIRDLWSGSRAIRLATKVKTKCERAWGKEKMRRQVAKLKRERGENGVTQPYRASRSGFREPDPPVDTGNHGLQGGRGNREGGRGRGRGGRSAGRGRGLEKGRGSKGPSGISGRDALRTSSPKRAPKESAPVKESETLKSPTRSKSKTSPPANSPASPRRKYQASLEGTPSPKKGSSKKIAKKNTLPPKPDLGDEDELRGPKGNDVCFRDSKCTGTKHLRTIVKHELKSDPQAEFSPILLNRILQRLDGRDFYVPDKNGGLKEASKNEITKEISKLFHSEKSKLQEKNAKSKLRNGGDEE